MRHKEAIMVLDELKKIISEKLGVDEADLTADTNLTDRWSSSCR